jgi:hypothetical protein
MHSRISDILNDSMRSVDAIMRENGRFPVTEPCHGCGKSMIPRDGEATLCMQCFRDNEEAKRDFEAEKQYQDRNQHWDI